jgi:hypothetical protein
MSDSGAHPRAEVCDEFTVVGTEVRTTYEAESDPTTAQIGAHWQRFYESALADRIPIARTKPSSTAYTPATRATIEGPTRI